MTANKLLKSKFRSKINSMRNKHHLLIALTVFNAVCATGGGIALMLGSINQPVWIAHTGFDSLYFPGVILFAVVGGSATIATIATIKKVAAWQLATLTSAVIMLVWIVGEIVSIRQVHWLQAVFAITALSIIYLTRNGGVNGKRKV